LLREFLKKALFFANLFFGGRTQSENARKIAQKYGISQPNYKMPRDFKRKKNNSAYKNAI
jgi:hypothetical protein